MNKSSGSACPDSNGTLLIRADSSLSGPMGRSRPWLYGITLSVSLLALASCGGGDGGGGGDPDPDARATAITQTADRSSDAIAAIAELAENSPLIQALLQSANITNQENIDLIVENLRTELRATLGTLLTNGSGSGSTITYNTDQDDICSAENGTLLALLAAIPEFANTIDPGSAADCGTFFSQLAVVQTITGDAQGTLDINYGGSTIVRLGYGPDSTFSEFDLPQLASLIGEEDVPETVEGVFRITLADEGPDHYSIALSIEEGIGIADASDDTDVNIASAQDLFEFIVDAPNISGSVGFGVAALDLSFPLTDDFDVDRLTNVDFNGLSFLVALEEGGEDLVVSSSGTGGPFTINVVDEESDPDPLDFSLDISSIAVTVDGDGSIVFGDAFDMALDINDPFGVITDSSAESSLDIEVDEGTGLISLPGGPGQPGIFQVQDLGRVFADGEGDSLGTEEFLSFTCFSIDLEAPFPFSSVVCPPS